MRARVSLLVVSAITFFGATLGFGQTVNTPHGIIVIPETTVEHPEDVGIRAHTNHLILVLPDKGATPTATSPQGQTPGTIRPVYNLPSTGGAGRIAIVDAFNYPTAQSDFDTFSSQFGLPSSTSLCNNGTEPCFKLVYATGVKPRNNCGWAQEAALDIEWAHTMSPSAQIILVEAKSNFFSDLFQAVDVATSEVMCGQTSCPSGGTGTGEVSMSWGGSEFTGEASNDFHFNNPGLVYFAASGDTGGAVIYPSASVNVVSSGGTTLHFSSGTFTGETGWSGSGGGPSAFELRPSYQNVIQSIVGSARGTPDFSFDADPNSGVSVFDSTSCQGLSGWLVFGGTSVASPSLSGIVNLAASTNGFAASSNAELTKIYNAYNSANYSTDFRDITSGTAGSFTATTGWDFVTGVGSNKGLNGK